MPDFAIADSYSRLLAKNAFDGNLVYGAGKFHSKTARTGKGKPSSGGMTRELHAVVNDTEVERYQRIEKHWEPVNECPVCGDSRRKFFLGRYGIDVYRCDACDHRYMHPRIVFDRLIEMYGDDKTAADIYTNQTQKDIDTVKYQYGYDLLEQLSPTPLKKLMDLGCGAGLFPEIAHAAGCQQCIGVDANSRYGDIYEASTSGVQFIQSSFEKLDNSKLGTDYDAISMWNVFEHLYDLHAMLESMKSLLRPGGLFLLMIPNIESLASRIIREQSPTFNWKHVHHFCVRSLRQLMQEHGYREVHMETVVTEIDNVKSYLSGEYPYHGFGDPSGLFDFITPEYLHDNLLGSRILAAYATST